MIESKMKKDFYIDENKQKGDDLLYKMVNKDPGQVENIENKIPGMNEFKIKRERLENTFFLILEEYFKKLYNLWESKGVLDDYIQKFDQNFFIDLWEWWFYISDSVFNGMDELVKRHFTDKELWILNKIEYFILLRFVKYLEIFWSSFRAKLSRKIDAMHDSDLWL